MATFANSIPTPVTGSSFSSPLVAGYNTGVGGAGLMLTVFNPICTYSLGCVNNGPGGLASAGQGQIFPTGRS
jgi:hypothetical protein